MKYENYDGEMIDSEAVDRIAGAYRKRGMPDDMAQQWALRDLKLSFGDVWDERAALWNSPTDLRKGRKRGTAKPIQNDQEENDGTHPAR